VRLSKCCVSGSFTPHETSLSVISLSALYTKAKVTIIWAPQSRTSASGANRKLRAVAWAVAGLTWHLGSVVHNCQWFFLYTDKIWANFWLPMHKHTAAEMGKSGQIRDTKPKMGQMGLPGELWFFPGYIVKNRTVPENPGWMVTLSKTLHHFHGTCFSNLIHLYEMQSVVSPSPS